MNARFVTSVLRGFTPALATVALSAMVSTSANAASLVMNGSFETTTKTTSDSSFQLLNNGAYGTVSGWTNTNGSTNGSYNFLMQSGGSAIGQYGSGLQLYGSPAGNLSGPPVSPDGGNFMALDSDFQDSAIQQTVSGLIAGDKYTVSFYYAATQQINYSGDTHETMDVTLGSGPMQSTTEITDDPSHDFTGWDAATLTFTATGGPVGSSVSDVLSFMAVGGGNYTDANVPSFALLDGVTMAHVPSPTPEPSSLVLLGSGLAGLAGLLRSRLAKATASAV
jgi:hypothetical protein